MNQAICENPILIIGSPRSGTSVLAWSLAQHPELWTSQESDLLFNLFGAGRLDQAFDSSESRPEGTWLKEQGVSKADFLRYLGLGLNAMFSSRSHPRRWVDQTPVNTLLVEALAEMFPGALFLHILRDGRRVVNSMVNFAQAVRTEIRRDFIAAGYLPGWAMDFREACRTWSTFAGKAQAFCTQHPERGFTVTNEELVRDPQSGFRRVLEFLGAAEDAAPAAFFSSNRINSSFGAGQPAPLAGDLSQPWLKWTAEQNQIFFEEAGAMMIAAGLASEEELAPRDPSGARLLLRTREAGVAPAASDGFRVRRMPLKGPVRQTSAPVGLWHDNWIGASLKFAVEAQRPVTGITIEGSFPVAFADAVAMTLTVSGREKTEMLAPCDSFRWRVPWDLSVGAKAEIEVASAATFCPKELLGTMDDRQLSFVLRGISFEEGEAA